MVSIYSDQYQYVIKKLRENRVAKGITQQQLALALNRHQSFIAKVEMGERKLDIVEFVLIARLLGFNPNSVLANVFKYQKELHED